jgi:hypothetical protein
MIPEFGESCRVAPELGDITVSQQEPFYAAPDTPPGTAWTLGLT